jgi:hypothetical protein
VCCAGLPCRHIHRPFASLPKSMNTCCCVVCRKELRLHVPCWTALQAQPPPRLQACSAQTHVAVLFAVLFAGRSCSCVCCAGSTLHTQALPYAVYLHDSFAEKTMFTPHAACRKVLR